MKNRGRQFTIHYSPSTMTLAERDNQIIWHPYTQMLNTNLPVTIVRGEKAYLYDEQGNRYIDAVSSWWVNIHGHAHPYIAQKVSEQLHKLEHVIFAGFTHPGAIELAERLLKRLPSNQSRIFYSDNGSTAVEVALKMAFQYHYNQGNKKTKVIAFQNAYHGDTFGAMSASGKSIFTNPFADLLFDVYFITPPVKGMEKQSLEQLKNIFQKQNSNTFNTPFSSFIFEPLIQGAAGMVMYKPEPLNELLKICKQNGVLTIADEVMTGFGRTGKFFASDFLTEQPDIMCLSKGLTGGTMALGVTSCTQKIYDAFLSKDKLKTFFHGHSFTANPLACVASLASMDLFETGGCMENIKRIEKQHKYFCSEMSGKKQVKEARSIGTVCAVELHANQPSGYLNEIRNTAYRFFMDRKIILRPLGNVLYIMPPYCITENDLNYIYSTVFDFIEKKSLLSD